MRVDLVFIDDEQDILNLLRLRFKKVESDKVKLLLFATSKEFEDYIGTTDAKSLCLVTDINMPNNKVLKTLTANRAKFSHVFTYLCSAYDQGEYEEMMALHDVQFFFKKPLLLNEMKDRIIKDLLDAGIKI